MTPPKETNNALPDPVVIYADPPVVKLNVGFDPSN